MMKNNIERSAEFSCANWTRRIPEGEIRRLLKFQVKYYFGGGLPGALPTKILAGIVQEIAAQLTENASFGDGGMVNQLFNYNKTSGSDSLRALLLRRLVERQHLPFNPANDFDKLLITSGAQQSIYALLDVMINPGDYILTAAPSYLGFVTPAVKLGARVVLCPSDEHGLMVDGILRAIEAVKRKAGVPPKILYVISDSDNPRGTTLPEDRRRVIFEIARKEGILIAEDGAYKEIQFGKARLKPIKSYDTDNSVVAYLASTSKEAGVLRIGYGVFPDGIRDNIEKAKGYYDLCSPALTQKIVEIYYSRDLDEILSDVLATYSERCSAMIQAVEHFFPAGLMTRPTGGFFVWWESMPGQKFNAKWFNEHIAIPNDTLFVPSQAFFPPEGWIVNENGVLIPFEPPLNGMRLSFSSVSKERIFEGIEILGRLLRNHLAA